MTLSLTCACGARLEIDDKFAGKVIQCPDCNRSLNTAPPLPEPTATSGYAIASYLLALLGAFTLVGTVAAIVCGVLAQRHIRRRPEEIGGRRLAKAGIILGSVFTLVTLVMLCTTDFLRLDGLVRTVEWAGQMDYTPDEWQAVSQTDGIDAGRSAQIKRPSASWGRLTYKRKDAPQADNLVLANLWEDAYIICLTKWVEPGQTLESCRQEGQQRLLQSELFTRILGRTHANSPPLTGQDRDRKQLPGTETQEFLLDIRLGGVDRTFLVRVLRDGTWLTIVAGGTRQSRFARLQPELVQALDSYKAEK